MNIFDNPIIYREKLISLGKFAENDFSEYKAKSFICLFLTRYCGVGCPFCFFKSPPKKKGGIEDRFSDAGIEKFIEFANEANVGYLQISGGGEPFLEKESIIRCIEKTNADRIILITSGMWAYTSYKAEAYLQDIFQALKNRKKPARLTIRLSVGEGYDIKLQGRPLVNLINIFADQYKGEKNFTLQVKTFQNDNSLSDHLAMNFNNYEFIEMGDNQSDDENLLKVMPQKFKIVFKDSGYEMVCGRSRIFNPGLRPDLNNFESVKDTIDVYDLDVEFSQKGFPSLVFDKDNNKGFDWIVEYNGNVCSWQNRLEDNLFNLYEDDYKTVLNGSFSDLVARSYIEKGAAYRDRIIAEISPKTVNLMKAVSVRDYAGNMLFHDEKIRLYYHIRVLQDYIKEGLISMSLLNSFLSDMPNLLKTVLGSVPDLILSYKTAKYSIVDQEIAEIKDPIYFRDFLELLKLNHFEVNDLDIKKAINYYNSLVQDKIQSLEDISLEQGLDIEKRLTDRVIKIKKMISTKENLEDNFFEEAL